MFQINIKVLKLSFKNCNHCIHVLLMFWGDHYNYLSILEHPSPYLLFPFFFKVLYCPQKIHLWECQYYLFIAHSLGYLVVIWRKHYLCSLTNHSS